MSTFFINLEKDTEKRYDLSKFLEFSDNYDPLTSSFTNNLISLPAGGEYTLQGEDSRPDLLSYHVYGDTQYWWVLLMYNSVIDYSELKTGTKIKYPNITDLESLYFSLKSQEIGNS